MNLRSVVAVVGGGNAGHALAVIASARAREVHWLTSTEERAARLAAGAFSPAGLRATGAVVGTADRVTIVSADPAAVIPGAALVLVALPAFVHAEAFRRIAPHLTGDAIVAVLPTRSGLEFPLRRVLAQLPGRTVVGLQSLPWLCRVRDPGQDVEIAGQKRAVIAAVLPPQVGPEPVERVSSLLQCALSLQPNFLNLTLGNPGQVIHPCGMYALFADPDRTMPARTVPRFYADLDEEAAALMDAVSREIVAVAHAVQDAARGRLDLGGVLHIAGWLRQTYASQIADDATLLSCLRTNGAYQRVQAPVRETSPGVYTPDFTHRFLSDDIPFGLAVTKGIAELTGLPTPTLDKVVTWAQERLGRDYVREGHLSGADATELRTPQNYGVHTLNALVEFYA